MGHSGDVPLLPCTHPGGCGAREGEAAPGGALCKGLSDVPQPAPRLDASPSHVGTFSEAVA